MDPRGISELIPDWKEKGAPLNTPVSEDKFLFLSEKSSFSTPGWMLPGCFKNHGNYVISLGNFTRWLGKQAEELGVEIFPGFAAAEVFNEGTAVKGVAPATSASTARARRPDAYQPGMELHGKYTLFAEGLPRAPRPAARREIRSSEEPPRFTASA
jgi:electron-transferring-flavoprotein dehydrogenase